MPERGNPDLRAWTQNCLLGLARIFGRLGACVRVWALERRGPGPSVEGKLPLGPEYLSVWLRASGPGFLDARIRVWAF